MEYLQLPKFENYRNLANQDLDKLVLVERVKPTVGLPVKYTCYILDHQNDYHNENRRVKYFTCRFWRGKGILYHDEIPIGTLLTNKQEMEFQVNNQTVVTFKMSKDQSTICNYKVKYEGQEYYMSYPKQKKGIPTLRYLLIKTAKLGVESSKNFALNDQQENRVLECIKVDDDHLLMACKPPMNFVIGAIIGILRYRNR